MADWVGSVGSLAAIGVVWWESKKGEKQLKQKIESEEEARYSDCIKHLRNIKDELSLIKEQINHKKSIHQLLIII